jgi:putative solute:sodium symporter small subunit
MNLFDGQFSLIQERARWVRTNRLMLFVLALWLAFALVVYLFVVPLNKITVPVLGMPLGFFIAAQGAVIVFTVMLFSFASKHGADRGRGEDG